MAQAKFTFRTSRNGNWEILENGRPMMDEDYYYYRNEAYIRVCELNGWKYDYPTDKQMAYLTVLTKNKTFYGSNIISLVNTYKASRKQVSELIGALKDGKYIDPIMRDIKGRL